MCQLSYDTTCILRKVLKSGFRFHVSESEPSNENKTETKSESNTETGSDIGRTIEWNFSDSDFAAVIKNYIGTINGLEFINIDTGNYRSEDGKKLTKRIKLNSLKADPGKRACKERISS